MRAQTGDPGSWEHTHGGHSSCFPERTHLSNPTGSGEVVVRKPGEEVKTAAVVSAAIGLNFIILAPLNWSGMRSPVFYRQRIIWEGGWNTLALIHPPSSFPYPSWEPPVTCDVHEILLANHFILEVGVIPKEQHDLAEMNGMLRFFHLSGQGGYSFNTFLGEVPTVACRNQLSPLASPTQSSSQSLPRLTSKLIM